MFCHRIPGPCWQKHGIEDESDTYANHAELVPVVPAYDIGDGLKALYEFVFNILCVIK